MWLYGLLMFIPLLGFAWRYPLVPNSGGLTDIGKLAQYERAEFIGYMAGMAALFTLYLLALRECRKLPDHAALPAVFGCGWLMAACMVWMYPVNAIDVFLYAVRSRLLTTYGVNPNSVPFITYPNDTWLPFATTYWAERLSPYGPLWNLVSAPFTALAGENMLVAVVGYKLLFVACLLLGGWVITRCFAAVKRPGGAAAALLYLWNPLVLWEAIGNAHNDVLLALLLLLAFWAWQTRRGVLVIPLLIAASLLKYVTLPLLPLVALALWRRASTWPARWWLIGWSTALSALVTIVALFPFYDLNALQSSVQQQGALYYTSPTSFAVALLNDWYATGTVLRWATIIGVVILVATVAWQLLTLWRNPERLPRACFEVTYVFLLVAVASSRSWYLIWLVALAALLVSRWAAWRTIAWSAGSLASYALFIWIEAWWQPGYDMMQLVAVPMILGGTLLLTAIELLFRLARRPTSARDQLSEENQLPAQSRTLT